MRSFFRCTKYNTPMLADEGKNIEREAKILDSPLKRIYYFKVSREVFELQCNENEF